MEATEICGYLEQGGVKATYERGSLDVGFWAPYNAAPGAAGVGPQRILVNARDAERARELLAEVQK